MSRVADYKIIKDDSFTLTSTPPGNSKEIKFDLDSPHVEARSILAFKLDLVNADNFRFNVKVNGTQVVERTCSGDRFFTFHEVIPANLLKRKDPGPPPENSIQFTNTNGTGSVKISDIVLWYQHRI